MSLSTILYNKLTNIQRQAIEKKYVEFRPSITPLIVHIAATFLSPAAVGTVLFSSLAGRVIPVNFTKFSLNKRITGIVSLSAILIFSLMFHVLKYGKKETEGMLNSIHSLIKDKLSGEAFTSIVYAGKTYYFDNTGFSEVNKHNVTSHVSIDTLL